jgi:hypothetical protein
MTRALRTITTVQQGGKIQIASSDLTPGTSVEVIVLQEEDGSPRRSMDDILNGYKGGKMFRSVEEVDRFVREERDARKREPAQRAFGIPRYQLLHLSF